MEIAASKGRGAPLKLLFGTNVALSQDERELLHRFITDDYYEAEEKRERAKKARYPKRTKKASG
jgi:hypothetical protein